MYLEQSGGGVSGRVSGSQSGKGIEEHHGHCIHGSLWLSF